jgi:hypothetical protein
VVLAVVVVVVGVVVLGWLYLTPGHGAEAPSPNGIGLLFMAPHAVSLYHV